MRHHPRHQKPPVKLKESKQSLPLTEHPKIHHGHDHGTHLGLLALPEGCEHSPHVLHDFEEVRVCARLERDDQEEGKPHRADEENHLLDEKT